MKHFATLSLMLLGISSLHAQSNLNPKKVVHATPYQKIIQRIVNDNQRLQAAQKTTAVKQRVVAEAGYNYDGTSYTQDDSTNFNYNNSTTRGSFFNLNSQYHNYYFPNNDVGLYPFKGGKADVMANNVKYWSIGTSATLDEDVTMVFTTGDNILDYKYISSNATQSYRYANNYDAQGRLTLAVILNGGPTTWDTVAKRVISYNTQNQVLLDSVFQYDQGDWIPAQVVAYTYNTSNRLIGENVKINTGSSFVDYITTAIDYYPNNDIKTVLLNANQGSGLQPNELDSFAYAPVNNYQTLHMISVYNNSSNQWDKYNLFTYNINSQNLPDTARIYNWNSSTNDWDLGTYFAFTFNSYNNPETEKTLVANGSGGFTYGYLYKFYYETYNATGIKETSTPNASILVYPNPASDKVNLTWKEADGKAATIELLNTSGQLVYSESFNWTQPTESLSLNSIAPGLYFITVRDHDGQLIFKQRMIKQ